MRNASTRCLCLLTLLVAAAPSAAQDASVAPDAPASSSGGTMSFFEAFFWPPGDVIGTAMVWGLILLSLVSTGYTILMWLSYRRATILPAPAIEGIEQLLTDKKYREAIEMARSHPSYVAVVVSAALEEAPNGYGAMERAVEEAADAEVSRMMRPLELLNVVGNIAPMLGLFGTVYGMIVAFQQLVASGGQPKPAELAGGISTALVTTFWGLLIAIPSLAAYALIRNRIDALTSEGIILVESLISTFKPGGKHKKDKDRAARPRATPQPKTDEPEPRRDEEPA